MNILSRITAMLFFSLHFFVLYTKPITIMVNPAGDAKQTGRKINGYFERGITLQFFEQFKNTVKKKYPDKQLRIVSTRFAGETIEELQNANFANRLGIDFYFSIHFYQEHKTKPDLFLYYFSYGDDFITKKNNDWQLWPYDKAHLINFEKTKHLIHKIKDSLASKTYAHKFTVQGIFKLPFAPLIGIVAPAIGIEIGLKSKDDWQQYIEPLVTSLAPIIETSKTSS